MASRRTVTSMKEHEDHPGETLLTQSPEVIRTWANERGGRPATVEGTEHGDLLGVLRFDFGDATDRLREVSWDEWLRTFQERGLTFIYQEHKSDGSVSNFFRLESEEREG